MTHTWTRGLLALGILLAALPVQAGDERRPAAALHHDPRQARVTGIPPRSSDRDRRLRVTLTLPMGDPGWTLTTRSVGAPDAEDRIRIVVGGTRKPGAWPAVITPMQHEVELPALREGAYLLDIWFEAEPHGARRAGASVITAHAAR